MGIVGWLLLLLHPKGIHLAVMVIPFWPVSRLRGPFRGAFDRGGDDIAPSKGMHTAHHTRSR